MAALFTGVLLAFSLILPLGVQNVFIFNQGAAGTRFSRALPAVITAAICDTLLILLAVLGLSVAVFAVAWVKTAVLIVGILFLIYMGFVTWKSASSQRESGQLPQALSARKQVAFAASVSLLNPHAILDTIGVIGTSSLHYSGADKILFTMSTIGVSWIWFISLAAAGHWLGKLDASGKWISWLNRASAVIIWGIAMYLAYLLILEIK
jgi:L-lysine exporter family protein LysE/ArgO